MNGKAERERGKERGEKQVVWDDDARRKKEGVHEEGNEQVPRWAKNAQVRYSYSAAETHHPKEARGTQGNTTEEQGIV